MKTFEVNTRHKKLLADTLTPVSIYLKLRDQFPNSVLLESSDYQSLENSYSFICCDPIAGICVDDGSASVTYPDKTRELIDLNEAPLVSVMQRFALQFKFQPNEHKFTTSGLFGYMGYNVVQQFEDISFNFETDSEIPDAIYSIFRFVIVVDHYSNQLYAFEHSIEGIESSENSVESVISMIQNKDFPSYPFKAEGEETSNLIDDEYIDMVRAAKQHCQRGDVFQMVLSRQFFRKFKGDEFTLYRALRSVNPSPYLFFFEYGDFRIFGSSPEAQLSIKGPKAYIHPIAGTYKRTGHDEQDIAAAKKLQEDPKENAEHVMLVDLARNDLSKHADQVVVEEEAEIQFYSHVIHMVSKVSGMLMDDKASMHIVADTFPAGTLSGAPKFKAMELIARYEKQPRTFYGGAIGFMAIGENGISDFNHAIIIRSFLSRKNQLTYQAGAGIVAASDEQNELKEVENKIGALRAAIEIASEL